MSIPDTVRELLHTLGMTGELASSQLRDEAARPIKCYPDNAPAFHDYDRRAPLVAAVVGGLVTSIAPELSVEHVGSTAVPGCGGKGIIDLLVLYESGRLEAAKSALAQLGFQPQSGGFMFPEDRPLRQGALDYDGARFAIHAHVVAASSPEVETLRKFRDLLRNDPRLLADYVARKREIVASGVSDRAAYTARKSAFVTAALAQPLFHARWRHSVAAAIRASLAAAASIRRSHA